MSHLLNYKIFLPENDASPHSPTPQSQDSQQHPPLLILHGLLGDMDNWRSQARRLSASRRVITLDLRNHGDSPHVKGMSYREMADDVIKVAQHEKIDRFDLLGHSMGGKVAMHLALTNQTRVRRLVVVDIAPRTYPLWHQNILKGLISAPLQSMQSRQQVSDYLESWIEDRVERAFILKNLKRVIPSDSQSGEHQKSRFAWRCNVPEISRNYLKIAGFSTLSSQFSGNSLFIRGENSSYIEPSDHALINSLFTKTRIISIHNSGHLPHFEQADEFFDCVNTFLSPV